MNGMDYESNNLFVPHCPRYQYDGAGSDGDSCKITEYNENLLCNITFDITEDIPGPAYVFYELTNFYQNHQTCVHPHMSSHHDQSTCRPC